MTGMASRDEPEDCSQMIDRAIREKERLRLNAASWREKHGRSHSH
jgi:hypothetical protein